MRRYVQVAVPVPLHQLFTYAIDGGDAAGPGHRVEVPFGPRRLVGVVVTPPTATPPAGFEAARIRPVHRVLDTEPVLNEQLMELMGWLVDYYHLPPGEAFILPLPPRMGGGRGGTAHELKKKTEKVVRFRRDPAPDERRLGEVMDRALSWLKTAGQASWRELRDATRADHGALKRLVARDLVAVTEREVARDPFAAASVERDVAPPPTDAQAAAVATLRAALGGYRGFLLHGVTGSGKTEVYLALIDAVLARGAQAVVLVPEIALTPQLVSRFRARLGGRIAVLHSQLDPVARHEQWLRISKGELPVVIGARSAVFAPVPELGLLVVDEEHEPSFKQDSAPRYNARDVALVRGQLAGAPVILGSATPSVESWANVERGKLARLVLAERVHERPMPAVELVDLADAAFADSERLFTRTLHEALADNFARGDQAILLINRRGFAAFMLCRACGHALDCPSCSVSYTWHRTRGRLVCHYCERVERPPPRCPSCNDDAMQEVGFGTERVEQVLGELLPPAARIARMDRDTTRGRALNRLLDRFRRREIDVLIGTQMVAKGHDFPGVTLVGVMLAEQSLRMPDFRAAERTFQLMTQIAGRAGRAEKPGRVLIQTWMPEHYTLAHARRHDAEAFLDEETRRRGDQLFPPWTHLALLSLSRSGHRHRLDVEAGQVARALWAVLQRQAVDRRRLVVVGPHPAPIERISERWRVQILLKAHDRPTLRRALAETMTALDALKLPRDLQIALDVDPLSFL